MQNDKAAQTDNATRNQQQNASSSTSTSGSTSNAAAEVHLLIVEDAGFMRELIKETAQRQGFNVVGEASNGIEAVEKVPLFQPNVVLMDLVLPQMNGIEASRYILSQFPQLPIIAMTTLDETRLAMQAIDVGCVSFIAKPFQDQDLVEAIWQAYNNSI